MKCDIVALKKGYRGIARTLESYIEDSQLLLDERVLYRLIEFYRKLVSYNIPCEMIAYSLEPLEDCYGYAIELLGLDVVCDMAESLIVM